jgi:uncharacterized protein (UPF0332 family)
MEIRNVEDCFRFRLLRGIRPDKEKSSTSLEVARRSLKGAEDAIGYKMFKFAVMESYAAMFHASRALLYRDGIQEKSQFAVYIYLREKYSSSIPSSTINLLNVHRKERHDAMYGLEFVPTKDDAETGLRDAKAFVREIEKII